jgi:hypothetical protein
MLLESPGGRMGAEHNGSGWFRVDRLGRGGQWLDLLELLRGDERSDRERPQGGKLRSKRRLYHVAESDDSGRLDDDDHGQHEHHQFRASHTGRDGLHTPDPDRPGCAGDMGGVFMRVHALQLHRAAPVHFRGLMGLGSCSPMGVKYSNTPNGACLNSNDGSVVDCLAAACSAIAAPAGGPSAGPNFTPDTTIQDIVVGGFTGDIAVPTLDAALSEAVAAKESPFIANTIAKGADSVAAEDTDIATQAQAHCTEYPASEGCGADMAGLIAQYQAQYLAWAQTQNAGTYQAADTGTLTSPLTASPGGGSAAAPVYVAPTPGSPSAGATGGSGSSSTSTSSSSSSGTPAATPFSWAFLTNEAIAGIPNWVLGVGVIGALIAFSMFSGRGK